MSTTVVTNGGTHDGAHEAAIPHGMDPAEYAKLQAAGQRLATAEEDAAPTGNPVKRWVTLTSPCAWNHVSCTIQPCWSRNILPERERDIHCPELNSASFYLSNH